MCRFCDQQVTEETDYICKIAQEDYANLGLENSNLKKQITRLVDAYEKLRKTAQTRLIELEREKRNVSHWYNQYVEYRDAMHLTNAINPDNGVSGEPSNEA